MHLDRPRHPRPTPPTCPCQPGRAPLASVTSLCPPAAASRRSRLPHRRGRPSIPRQRTARPARTHRVRRRTLRRTLRRRARTTLRRTLRRRRRALRRRRMIRVRARRRRAGGCPEGSPRGRARKTARDTRAAPAADRCRRSPPPHAAAPAPAYGAHAGRERQPVKSGNGAAGAIAALKCRSDGACAVIRIAGRRSRTAATSSATDAT